MRSQGDVSRVFLASAFCFYLVGSKGNVSAVFCLRFRSVFAACRFVVLEAIFFFVDSVGNVSPVFCLRFRSVFGPFWARI